MFFKLFCVFIVLCDCVRCAEYNYSNFMNTLMDVKTNYHEFPKAKLHKNNIFQVNYNAKRTKNISKRGIVMVDSDFDIPSEIYTYENENDLNTGDIFEKNDGSGTDEFHEEFTKNTTEEDIEMESEFQKEVNVSTISTNPTIKTTKPTTEKRHIVTSINTEGSGDYVPVITEEYSIKEISTKTYTTPGYEIQERLLNVCLNSTCEEDDLFIFTSEERLTVAEGTNFTLTCISNYSDHYMLHWYKNNGSNYFLQTLGTNATLRLNIPDITLMHSGLYMCVKWVNKQTCCNAKSNLIIYKEPLYKYHLTIAGLCILAGLILCIFLTVRRSITLKKYTKEFAEKHGNFKSLL